MTVNQMIILSRVFLGMMIFFLIAAIVVFFLLDVRRAWRILSGKRVPVQQTKKERVKVKVRNDKANTPITREVKSKEIAMEAMEAIESKEVAASMEATTLLDTNESIDNNYEGYHPTTVLTDAEGETTVLADQNDSRNDIVTDITFIHTEIML